jgi:hypothetical protein
MKEDNERRQRLLVCVPRHSEGIGPIACLTFFSNLDIVKLLMLVMIVRQAINASVSLHNSCMLHLALFYKSFHLWFTCYISGLRNKAT